MTQEGVELLRHCKSKQLTVNEPATLRFIDLKLETLQLVVGHEL